MPKSRFALFNTGSRGLSSQVLHLKKHLLQWMWFLLRDETGK